MPKIDILLILTNHYFHAQNLSVKNGENNGLLAGVPFLSPSRAQIPPSPYPFNVCHAGYDHLCQWNLGSGFQSLAAFRSP